MTECAPVKTGPTDSGRVAIGVAWQAAAAALTLLNTVTAIEMADKQFDLANRYYQIARSWKDWYDQGFVPLENAELEEVMNEPLPEPRYDVAAGRAAAEAKKILDDNVRTALRCTNQYATGLRQKIARDGAAIYEGTVAAALSLGYRNERTRVELMKDRRWKRKEAAAMRGRDMAAQNVVFGRLAGSIYGDLGRQAGIMAGDWMFILGYGRERLETLYADHPANGRFERSAKPTRATDLKSDLRGLRLELEEANRKK
jgi:hypothetical protein